MTGPLTLNVQPVVQPIGTYYAGVISAYDLLEICRFDYRRIEERGGYKDFLGIQRKLSETRVQDIRKYIGTRDAVFPTSIVISVDERCAELVLENDRCQLVLNEYNDPEHEDIRIAYNDIATIIDGQHRLKAFDGLKVPFDLSVAIFVGIDDALEASIFSIVNLAQTKVNKSLVYDLFALDRDRSPEKTCHELVVALDSLPDSPFAGRIKRLGAATEGRFGETLSQATVVRGILPYITRDPLLDRDLGKRVGFWPERGVEDFEKRIFYPFFRQKEDEKILAIIVAYFQAVRDRWPDAWANTGRGAILNKTNGYNGLMRFLREAYLYLTQEPRVVRKSEFDTLFASCELTSDYFTTANFPPGSSGASKLFRELVEATPVGSV